MNSIGARLALAAVIAIVAGGFLYYSSIPRTYVILDNASNKETIVLVDGKQVAKVAPHKFVKLDSIKGGKHKFLVKSGDETIDEAEYEVKPAAARFSRTCQIYNMSGDAEYVKTAIACVKEGSRLIGKLPDDVFVGAGKRFFEVADSNCNLDASMGGEKCTLNKGQTQRIDTYLCHWDAEKEDYGCAHK